MNSKSIYKCFNCNQDFCGECSNAGKPLDYCSSKCQQDQEVLNEPEQESLVFKLAGLKKGKKK